MAMNSDAAPKHGGGGGGELEKRMTAVEARLGVIEKTMVTTEAFQREFGAVRDELHMGLAALRREVSRELGNVRVEIEKIPFELVKWLIALFGIATAIATAIYNLWFR
jgi:hypothetical protein